MASPWFLPKGASLVSTQRCQLGFYPKVVARRHEAGSRRSVRCVMEERSSGRLPVRLAEIVASLSLGVDLGFGQPMEHVLRQCLIALRVAERVGLDDDQRSVVYYTALLVNVGCHADAHEQAKWFGDDIVLKSGKYDHDPGSLRAVAASLRLVGSGNPPLHRFRVGLEFVLAGIATSTARLRGTRRWLGLWRSNSGCPTPCRRLWGRPTSSGMAADGRGG
jgi:hypothetical protein